MREEFRNPIKLFCRQWPNLSATHAYIKQLLPGITSTTSHGHILILREMPITLSSELNNYILVRMTGLEPARLSTLASQARKATNYITSAYSYLSLLTQGQQWPQSINIYHKPLTYFTKIWGERGNRTLASCFTDKLAATTP